jgi:hypothetical protein
MCVCVCVYISTQHPHEEGVGVGIRSVSVERLGNFLPKMAHFVGHLAKTRWKLVFPGGHQSLERAASNVPPVRESFSND